MKTQFLNKLLMLLIITSVNQLITTTILAQTPEKMSYQAVIRDSGNKLVQNKTVSMRISILQGSPDGSSVYSETQNPTTNANGLVSIEYGSGSGFITIKWENGPYFIKTETDPNGGSNYSITGTSQMLSVPYALYSKKTMDFDEKDPLFKQSVAAKITADDTTYWNGKQDKLIEGENIKIQNNVISATGGGTNPPEGGIKVGDYYGGGVVAWVNDAGTHGLILAMVDQSTTPVPWSNIQDISIGDVTGKYYDGLANSNKIISQSGHTSSAAKLCLDYTNADYGTGVFSDWYLPSRNELILIETKVDNVIFALINDLNPLTTSISSTTQADIFWTSTEYSSSQAIIWYLNNYNHQINDEPSSKSDNYRVRAVRIF